MRHFILIVLSFTLTACASLGGSNDDNEPSIEINKSKKVEYSGTAFSKYLKDYLAKNINHRTRTSRNLIDRSGIESNGRLPSKALYQSLGYRVRDSFVTLPPELSTRSISNPDVTLLAQLIQSSETTWALLDTTKERLKSKGGLEEGRADWEVSITRRNLLSEATGYWYQMRNQGLYNDGVTRLEETTSKQFDEITEARQHYDVEDLRDKELALLGMKSDIALIFQFYSSEQARLFNRIDSRVLPNDSKRNADINKTSSCGIDSRTDKRGKILLERKHASQVRKIRNNPNKKAAIYELNELARDIASKALKVHAGQLNVIEKEFLIKKEVAEKQREIDVQLLIEKQARLVELGEEVNPDNVELLKSAPLDIKRRPLVASEESSFYYDALSVLSSWVIDELVDLNQKRLTTVLSDINSLYVQYQEPIWQGVSSDVSIIRELLYEIYDYTLLDYLLSYERVVFANKAMLHSCKLNSELSARNILINHQTIDQFAALVETNAEIGFPRSSLKNRFQSLPSLKKALTANPLGKGFNKKSNVITKPTVTRTDDLKNVTKADEVQSDEALKAVKAKLARNGFVLATTEEVLTFADKDGYSVEVGSYTDAESALGMIKRFKRSVPKLIYLSKRYKQDKSIILKVLIGNEKEIDAITNLRGRINFGDIKSFNDIRNDI